MKKEEKKKGKNKKSEKLLKKGVKRAEKRKKEKKVKESKQSLKREVQRLREALQVRDDQLKELLGGQRESAASNEAELLAQSLAESADMGSVGERKKIWERHQYLRSRYEAHLEAGMEKGAARHAADQDLRSRYGDEIGYTAEQLDAILS